MTSFTCFKSFFFLFLAIISITEKFHDSDHFELNSKNIVLSSVEVRKISKFQHITTRPTKSIFALYIFNLLLLCAGDIESNPGPVKFPCGACKKAVKWTQR